MRKPKTLPSQKHLVECFNYDPLTGELFWKHRPPGHFNSKKGWLIFNTKYEGTLAGHRHYDEKGRIVGIRLVISLMGKAVAFYAHRIIYGLMGIEIPEGFEVDHKNMNPGDNFWLNLRIATRSQNNCNSPADKNKSSGLPKGVFKSKNGLKFTAEVSANGTRYRLGVFDTPKEAHAAYCKKSEEIHGEFARFN